MDKIIITVAPTGNVPTRQRTPHVPITPEEIARSVKECRDAGAALAHVHARDEEQRPTYHVEVFRDIVAAVRGSCDIITQVSTGARAGRTAEERAQCLAAGAEMASLTTGSSNFATQVNDNAPDLVEHLCRDMAKRGIVPEIEIFDAAMISLAVHLAEKGLIPKPLHFNLVLGVPGSLPATPKNLFFLYESLPQYGELAKDLTWQVTVVGPPHVDLSVMAMSLGGNVRVGLEDNIYYSRGVLASNVRMVERMVGIARAMGREPVGPDEARKILNLSAR